jgi:hypothetical protein
VLACAGVLWAVQMTMDGWRRVRAKDRAVVIDDEAEHETRVPEKQTQHSA